MTYNLELHSNKQTLSFNHEDVTFMHIFFVYSQIQEQGPISQSFTNSIKSSDTLSSFQ